MQDIADVWMSYKGPNGRPLNVRPHWAKEWQGLTLRDRPAVSHLRSRAYAARIPEFRAGVRKIARQGGYTTRDLRVFSNPLLDRIFRDVFE